MTDITDRHTLRRMSWSELITAGQEAEFQRDYERARIVWSFALHVATTTINKNLAIAHIRRCDTLLHKSKAVPGNTRVVPVSESETSTSRVMIVIPD